MAQGAEIWADVAGHRGPEHPDPRAERRGPAAGHGDGPRSPGQLAVAADVVAMLDMPVLAEFLADKGDDLRDLAVDAIIKFAAAHAMANTMESIGAQVGEMGADEMVEGLARRTVADAAAQHSEDLAMAGLGYAVSGMGVGGRPGGQQIAPRDEMAVKGVAERSRAP